MGKVLKVLLIIVAVIAVLVLLGYLGLKWLWHNIITAQMAPDNYTTEVKTGGVIEARYMANGGHEAKCFEIDYPDNADIKKIEIWYPEDMENSDSKYPVVLLVNGTGVGASRYKPVFEHLASWGFIAIGNEDPSTWEGRKTDATLDWLLKANEDENSIFYQKIDLGNIGVTGHSQGGVGVYNTINATEHKDLYKCAVSLSPTEEETAAAIKIPYNPAQTAIPIFMLCGTNNDVISPENMTKSYEKVTSQKVMAVRKNAAHGDMLYTADGYVTAWFMWQLQGDTEAAKAFIGGNPEILNNELYKDQKINIGE